VLCVAPITNFVQNVAEVTPRRASDTFILEKESVVAKKTTPRKTKSNAFVLVTTFEA